MNKLTKKYDKLALVLLACAAAQGATVNTTMTVTGSGTLSGTSVTVTGTANLTNIPNGSNGTFSATISLTSLTSANISVPFTITLQSKDTLTGTLTIPATLLLGTSTTATGSGTITGGTGAYSGATGSFPSLTGSGSINTTTFAISFTFTGAGTITTGGPPAPTPPTVTAVLDAASNTATLAQGTIFIVKGSSLCPSGTTFFNPPRPTVSPDGVKITFTPTAGGAATDAFLWYEYNPSGVCQLAGILPSTVAVGSYNVTVTNGTASSPFPAQVVANKLSLFTQDSTGTGQASAQNFISATVVDLNRLTTGSISGVTYSPAHPGQAVIAYGTGLGGYAAGDNSASPVFDFSKTLTIQAIVGGVAIPVAFAGRAGYAGEDQINFTLPANIPTGCAVPLQISVNGTLSVPTSIAIAPDANSNACVQPGFTTAQLQKLDQGGTITTGAFSITQFTITSAGVTGKSNTIGGGFSQLTGFQLSAAAQANVSLIQSGSCQVIRGTSSGGSASTGSLTYLDAGTVTISGPSGSSLSNLVLTKTKNSYSLFNFEGISVPGQVNFSLPAGNYSLSGAGGNDVGSFNTSLTLASPLTVTGALPSTVVRSSPLTINWTGGNASDSVEIIGSTSTTSGSGTSAVTSSATFICLTTAGPGTFTVPASILGQMYATTTTNPGSLVVASGNYLATFTATLKADGSSIPGTFGSFLGVGNSPAYQ